MVKNEKYKNQSYSLNKVNEDFKNITETNTNMK